jgi:hypothetical protein
MKYLVLTGNEYGYDVGNMIDLIFRPEEEAEELYQQYLKDYACASMYRVLEDRLELVKEESEF